MLEALPNAMTALTESVQQGVMAFPSASTHVVDSLNWKDLTEAQAKAQWKHLINQVVDLGCWPENAKRAVTVSEESAIESAVDTIDDGSYGNTTLT